jgi:ubiquinone/menaquinone biosynthesis C-methylase UbiE
MSHVFHIADREVLRLLTQAGLGRGLDVVEFGCGSGSLTRLLAQAVGPAGRVLGLDLAAFSVARARELAAQENLDNVTFQVADLTGSRLSSDYADLCLARQALGSASSPEMVIREMTRVVRPGGLVAVFEGDDDLIVYEPEPPFLGELRDALARDRLAGGGSRVAGRSLYRLLSLAGLAGVRVVALTFNSTEPDWPAAPEYSRPPALLIQAVGRLVEKGRLSRDEGARYGRGFEELAGNPLSFVFACSFFAYGRRPLRCA